MIGKKDNIIERIYKNIKHVIDDIYRKKGLTSEEIRKYFLIRRNFNRLLGTLRELKFSYEESNYEIKFNDQVHDILFNRILQDRIYYEKDNPQNESIIKNYEFFVNEKKS